MKRIIPILIMSSLVFFGCSKKKAEKADKIKPKKANVKVSVINHPLPAFGKLFASLDFLNLSDFDKVLPKNFDSNQTDIGIAAIQLGRLTADGIIATQAHNKTVLLQIAQKMVDISKFLGIKNDILQLANKLETLIKNDKWEELKAALDNYKSQVEISLYETRQYDLFTLLQLGGWLEGLNKVCELLNANYSKEKTTIINQKGILNSLLDNLINIQNKTMKKSKYVQKSIIKLESIKKIIDSKNDYYSKEEISKVYTLTKELISNF